MVDAFRFPQFCRGGARVHSRILQLSIDEGMGNWFFPLYNDKSGGVGHLGITQPSKMNRGGGHGGPPLQLCRAAVQLSQLLKT